MAGTYLKLVLLREAFRCPACGRMTNKTHDADDGSMLVEYLRDFVHTVSVLREDYHSRAGVRVIGVIVLETDKMIEDDLFELCQLGMTDGQ